MYPTTHAEKGLDEEKELGTWDLPLCPSLLANFPSPYLSSDPELRVQDPNLEKFLLILFHLSLSTSLGIFWPLQAPESREKEKMRWSVILLADRATNILFLWLLLGFIIMAHSQLVSIELPYMQQSLLTNFHQNFALLHTDPSIGASWTWTWSLWSCVL